VNWEEINFNRDQVLNGVNPFFNFGISHEYNEIEIIEKALNATHEKLIDALKNGTHSHKKNMIYTFTRLIKLYEKAFYHAIGYYNKCLAEICLNRFKKNSELIETISAIILHDGFTHYEHNILLRPYLFDFRNECFIHSFYYYKSLRGRLEKKITELLISWISEDEEEVNSIIDESILKIIKGEEVELIE